MTGSADPRPDAEDQPGHQHPAPDPDHDSAGVAWSGRALTSTGFDGDAGDGDPAVLTVLRAYAAGPPVGSDPAGLDRQLVAAVAGARWLVPVSAVATDLDDTGGSGGLAVEKSVDMAVAILEAPDGRRALPVFSSLQALAAWDPAARPVPVSADRAAQSAVADGCQSIVIDLADAHAVELRPTMVWALAMRRDWVPAHEDAQVAAAVHAAIAPHPEIGRAHLSAGDPPGTLVVSLALQPGLDAARVAELATGVAEAMAADGEVRARIDALTFTVSPVEPEPVEPDPAAVHPPRHAGDEPSM